MKIAQETLTNISIDYDISKLGTLSELLFFDIETTGFTARSSYLYLIGCAYFKNNTWQTIQWFAEDYSQEKDILELFFEFLSDYKKIIHFNGNHFDLPYIKQKCEQLDLPYNFDAIEGIDLYKRIAPCKFFLNLPSVKQKSVEAFLGINRDDAFSGGELIGVYHDYVKNPSEFSRNSLLLHNEEDLKGMLQILPMLSYYDLFNEPVLAKKVQANSYKGMDGSTRQELLLTVSLPCVLPKPVSASANGCYFRAEGSEGTIRVPIIEEELKFFYAGYQDYYYLPEEDLALHKSVASFVDKDHRMQATAATCYTRCFSKYLPQWDTTFEPVFRRDYRSKELFFELTDERKRNRSAFSEYAVHIISMIGSTY